MQNFRWSDLSWSVEMANRVMSKPFYHWHQSFSCRPWAIISTPDASNGWYLWNDMKEWWGCWGTVMSTVLFIEWNTIIQYLKQQYKIKMAWKIKINMWIWIYAIMCLLFVESQNENIKLTSSDDGLKFIPIYL